MNNTFRNPDLQREFDRNGYVVVDCLDPAEVDQLRAVWRDLPNDLSPERFSATLFSGDLKYREQVHARLKRVFQPKVEGLLDDYRICYCSFVFKPARSAQSTVELHQDWTFVDESVFQPMACWCPLVDVDAANGCLRVVPGSHKLNRRPRGLGQPRFPYESLLSCMERGYMRDVPMKAGQAFVYTQTLFHSSPPNTSGEDRLVAGALAIPSASDLRFLMKAPTAADFSVYSVPDDFYWRYVLGSAPDAGWRIGSAEDEFEPLSEETLERTLGALHATRPV
jgi:Phytanoyl-CoA dioxygenase (PhyH)